ncbi:MAG: 5-(carboxyamino)imidazole ribonucleotide mutase [candidate division KSB1 bacterium]|nr:5-(carboxyamino)imidazole ribonucleotide mutase [candidate division KSB1 bacterium]MDZ7365959.1 5-(carboxyamino)imidazole ribonucleotide mutase [candidate division KSB1 bacterium]MDZ7404075.1 5-(carboxyamino)imidazole ribonucleotide mutase [candidate division KSB1 bacterium]
MPNPLVGIIMGSDSDLPVMQQAAEMLTEFGVPHEITIVSAHRTPQRLFEYARAAEARGLEIIIAGAGGAAHLPGMAASLTPLPVIGVPVKASSLEGLDALLSIVQMPAGVPVATVAINNAKNAGILAAQILGVKFPEIRARVAAYKTQLEKTVLEKAEKMEKGDLDERPKVGINSQGFLDS